MLVISIEEEDIRSPRKVRLFKSLNIKLAFV